MNKAISSMLTLKLPSLPAIGGSFGIFGLNPHHADLICVRTVLKDLLGLVLHAADLQTVEQSVID